jgi:hypothetical protein
VYVQGSAGMCQVSMTAVVTSDGGVTWHGPAAVRGQDAGFALAFHGARPFLLNASCATPYATLQGPSAPGLWAQQGTLGFRRTGMPTVVSVTPSGSFAALAYASGSAGLTPRLQGFVYRTAARAWHGVPIASAGLAGRVVALSFVSAQGGIVATQNGEGTTLTLWSTANGGRTWTRAMTVAGSALAQLDLVTAHVAYAAVTRPSAAPSLYKSTDGGRTWRAVTLPG